jgi:hypothetical protein
MTDSCVDKGGWMSDDGGWMTKGIVRADDDDLIDRIDQLTDEARVALLEAIKAGAAASGSGASLEKLAVAYALVIGAKEGVLP